MADVGAIRFGSLWLDKEDRALHWTGSTESAILSPTESEIVRLLIGVSHRDANEGGIVSTSEFQHWLDESRSAKDKICTSDDLVRHYISNIRKKLKLLTGDAITIELEGPPRKGTRGYFLKINEEVDNETTTT